MSKATIAKLAVLIFLAFIVCLPEFFPSEVLQVQFLCAPFNPCDPNSGCGHYDGHVYDNAGVTLPQCEAQNSIIQDEAVTQWFVCETYADLQSLRNEASISEKDLEAIVTLQIIAPHLLQNVTVNGHVNHSGIYIETQLDITLFGCCVQNNSPQQRTDETARSSTSTPGIFSAGSTEKKNGNSSEHTHNSNITHCLVCFKDIQGMSSTTVKWWSVRTIVWLVLVLMVIVLVILGVRDQVFKNKHCCKGNMKPVRVPAKQPKTFSKRRVKSLGDLPDNVSALRIEDLELFLEKTPADYSGGRVTPHQRRVSLVAAKRLLNVFQESYKRGLSPIPELSTTDVSLGENDNEYDEEASSDGVTEKGLVTEGGLCLDVPLTPANTHSESFTYLHHRIHSSSESCH